MKILLTSIGRRVQLIKLLSKQAVIIGCDSDRDICARFFVNQFYDVPKFDDTYVNALLDICEKESPDFLIPLHEHEFELLANNRTKFEEKGVFLLLSSQEALEIFMNKRSAYHFFIENKILTPHCYTDFYDVKQADFPVILKPIHGMGSRDIFKISTHKALAFYLEQYPKSLIQSYKTGVEYTIDCFSNNFGELISVIPRVRLEVRAGEVTKTRVVMDDRIIKATEAIFKKIRMIGPITIQGIKTDDGAFHFIEINLRFGGGTPTAILAGANYCEFLSRFFKPTKEVNQFLINPILMMRYDEAVIV